MINFYIPDFIKFFNLNISLVKLLQDYPKYFYEDIQIKGVYGSLSKCSWNGGRIINYYNPISTQLSTIIQMFNNLGVSIRYTFTNSEIKKQHLQDIQGNVMMRLANNGMNDVIIYSELLENYLRKNYPNFKYISSVTKCLETNEEIQNEFLKNYDFIVIDQNKNRDIELLQSLDTNKIELLINSYCFPNCPYKKQHYKDVSLVSLQQKQDSQNYTNCLRATEFKDILNNFTTIKQEELYNYYYNKLHIYNFKLEGRSNDGKDLIENYLYYLVKPEYHNLVRNILIKYI